MQMLTIVFHMAVRSVVWFALLSAQSGSDLSRHGFWEWNSGRMKDHPFTRMLRGLKEPCVGQCDVGAGTWHC